VVEALKALGPSDATTNIWGARWGKMLVNCMGNALAGIIGPDTSKLTGEQRDAAGIIRAAAGCEVVRVAEALGVVVEPLAATGVPAADFAKATTLQAIRALRDKMDQKAERRSLSAVQISRLGVPGRPSLLQDVIKGRRTEVEELNGHVVRKGKEVGVPTPVNQAIVDTMNRIETGSLRPDPGNLDRLRPYIPH
jgi:2-dehydropantoate 2-reductase